MKSIVTITLNPSVDVGTRTERVIPGRKLRCEEPVREPGGGGINVSRAIKRLGGETVMVHLAGGPTSETLHDLLRDEDLNARPVEMSGWTRENIHVFETSTSQEYRFGMPGPRVSEHEISRCVDILGELDPPPDYVVGSGSLPPGAPDEFYGRLSEKAAELGARLVVDTSGQALRHAVEKGAFLIKPNLRELQDLVGRELPDEVQQERAAREILAGGNCEVIVLSLGAGGAWVMARDVSEHIRTPSVPIRSRVGAGDSMVAGTVLALSRGMDVVRAVRFGVASGAAAVMTEGTELCRREDAERLFEQMEECERAGRESGKQSKQAPETTEQFPEIRG